MTILDRIRLENPEIQIQSVTDLSFANYGRVIQLPYQTELNRILIDRTEIPKQNNVYVRDDSQFLLTGQREIISRNFYGEQPIEIGYCNGNSNRINAFEFHNCSELNLAGTDLILWLTHRRNLVNNQTSTAYARAFFVPHGTAIEVYPTTLHFAPNRVLASGFKCLVILTAQTNSPLKGQRQPDDLLFQHNKWLLTHPDNQQMVNKGAFVGLSGENYYINPVTEATIYE
ncbi:DUF4867 family protein [Secundilactobacillus folii]|uniref:DUF4867 family protein n=1 Tax=Secundilactobacillus folii TaxID=2678357 RepID=UPI0015650EAD|nr:DUF4867 family protein [Secundilactobacillus folii]